MSSSVTSCGERFTTDQRKRKVRDAKKQKLEKQIEEHGYNFCEECNRNESSGSIDCSHDVSVKKACETGRTELCWDTENITIRCRKCHEKHDNTGLRNAYSE